MWCDGVSNVENCPNPKCRFELEREIEKMVTKASLWKFVSIFGVIIILGAVGMYSLATENRARVSINERVLQEKAANIERTMENIQVLIKENIQESKEARTVIHKRITEECRPR